MKAHSIFALCHLCAVVLLGGGTSGTICILFLTITFFVYVSKFTFPPLAISSVMPLKFSLMAPSALSLAVPFCCWPHFYLCWAIPFQNYPFVYNVVWVCHCKTRRQHNSMLCCVCEPNVGCTATLLEVTRLVTGHDACLWLTQPSEDWRAAVL